MSSNIKSRRGGVAIGVGCPTRVMALTGVRTPRDLTRELKKIDSLTAMDLGPDIIADLSIAPKTARLWRHVIKSGCASSTVPIYSVARKRDRVDARELLDVAVAQMEAGVGLLTIHPTSTPELVSAAMRRLTPWTSRGGGIVIGDQCAKNRRDNVYVEILPQLVEAARANQVVLSIGATFRSSNIFDSLDAVQRAEIEAQLRLAASISAAGVGVVIESPGHARPSDIQKCAKLLARAGVPIMPLGPIPTDAAVGYDHVAAAIGATLMGMAGAAHILAAVTRQEHMGGVPSLRSTLEAVRCARVAAHIIDIHCNNDTDSDSRVARERAVHDTCVVGKTASGCSRCASTCPLLGRVQGKHGDTSV